MSFCIQPVYAIPVGNSAQPHARSAIHHTIATGNRWLAARDGGHRLRICGKTLVVRLPYRASGLYNLGTKVWTAIDKYIPARPNTINAVFINAGLRPGGRSSWPPLVPGHTSIISIGPTEEPIPWGLVFLHEVFHSLGLAPKESPHSDGDGHVTDDVWDLMAPVMSSPAGNVDLDYGHDDYWAALLSSPYLI